MHHLFLPHLPLRLATASFDSTINLWDVETGKVTHTMAGHREQVCSVAFAPSGEFIASGSFDRTVKIWEVKSGALVKTFHTGIKGEVHDVTWSANGERIAISCNDGLVRIAKKVT